MNFIFSLLALEITGAFFILLVIRRTRYDYSVPELLTLSFFLGAGFVSYQLFLYHLSGIGFGFLNLIIVPVVLLILIFARYASRPERIADLLPEKGNPRRWSRTEKLLAAGLFFQLLWIVLLVAPVPVHSHDAVANYALKARIFHSAGGIPEGFFGWNEATVAHPDYPLLLPFLMTWIYAFTGFNDLNVNMIMPVIYLAFLVLFYSQMKKLFSRQYSILLTFILGTTAQVADYAVIIHADLILTAFVTCAFVYFMLYVRTKDRICLILSSVLFGFSLWVKNEAMVFTGAFAAAAAASLVRSEPFQRRRALADVVIAFAVVAALAAPWFCLKFSGALAVNSDMDFSRLTSGRLWQNIRDIPILLNFFQQEVFGPKKWNIFWIVLLAGAIWKRKTLWKGECFYVTFFLLLSAAGYFAAYMAMTGDTLFFYVNTTISRFMLHFCGAALLLLAYLLKDDIRAVASFNTA
ncbi:MAG: hypothetical protein DRP85_01410 [Candidatus Makaraimicrobium thalassicum]|nr:MAG: hypothetical protein DRP85_01410 [Candidatus Omnitrophota bacterium]